LIFLTNKNTSKKSLLFLSIHRNFDLEITTKQTKIMAQESSHVNDDAIMAQVEAIKKETATAPAVGDLEPIQTLLDEFSNSDVFSKKIRVSNNLFSFLFSFFNKTILM
jgi:hypothetical protein